MVTPIVVRPHPVLGLLRNIIALQGEERPERGRHEEHCRRRRRKGTHGVSRAIG